MSRSIELLKRYSQESGLQITVQSSGVSEAEYALIASEDGELSVKIRIANHEARPSYQKAYGYADFEIPKNDAPRPDTHGDVYDCIRWLAARFDKPVPEWATETTVQERRRAAERAAASRSENGNRREAGLIAELLQGDRSKRLTLAGVAEKLGEGPSKQEFSKVALSRIASAFNTRRKANHVEIRWKPHRLEDRASGVPRKPWHLIVERPWHIHVQGIDPETSDTDPAFLLFNLSRRLAEASDARDAAIAIADQFGVELQLPSRQFLAAEYIDRVGYDPFEDDPSLTAEEVNHTLQEIHEIAQGEVQAEQEGAQSHNQYALPEDGALFKNSLAEVSRAEVSRAGSFLVGGTSHDLVEASALSFSVSAETSDAGESALRKRLWRTARYARDGGVLNGKPVWAGVADEHGTIIAAVSHEEAAEKDFLPERYLPDRAYRMTRFPGPGIFFHYNLNGDLDLTSHSPVSRSARSELEQSLDRKRPQNHWTQDQGHLAFSFDSARPWRKTTVALDRFDFPAGRPPGDGAGDIAAYPSLQQMTGGYVTEDPKAARMDPALARRIRDEIGIPHHARLSQPRMEPGTGQVLSFAVDEQDVQSRGTGRYGSVSPGRFFKADIPSATIGGIAATAAIAGASQLFANDQDRVRNFASEAANGIYQAVGDISAESAPNPGTESILQDANRLADYMQNLGNIENPIPVIAETLRLEELGQHAPSVSAYLKEEVWSRISSA